MKLLLAICLSLGTFVGSYAQESKKVTMKITYKGNPLCHWDVTIKHGDVEIGRGTTDESGNVDFGTVRLLSKGIDAYGYKKTANGDKKWDVKGYITLDDKGHANFDFLPLVEDMGMGGMIESAWGLTLNDCNGSSGSSGAGGTSSSSGGSKEQNDEMDEWEKEQEAKRTEQKAKQDQWNADWESGKTQAEGLQNSKQMQENKIATLGAKIEKRKGELAKLKAGTAEYSEMQYEIRGLEIERSLTELKLEKTNKMIASGNNPISKADKISLESREEPLKAEEDSLKQAQKSGALYGNGAVEAKVSETKTEVEKVSEDVKTKEVVKEEEKKETKEEPKKEAEENEDVLKIYTAEEIATLSVMNIKKLKLESNSKITNKKMALKTKSAMMKPEKIKQYEKDIADLQKQIELFDAELAKRKAAEETKE